MKKAILISLLLVYTVCNTAHADIFKPVGQTEKLKATEAIAIPGVDPNTLLGEATQILAYLGPQAGPLLDKHGTTTYLAATIVTYDPWGLSLNAGTTNLVPDGGAATINWNFGQYIPVANVPILSHVTSESIGAGVDYRKTAKSNSDPTEAWGPSWAVTAQIKGTF